VFKFSVDGRGVVGGVEIAKLETSSISGLVFDVWVRGVVFVGAALIISVIKSGTVVGVTFSTKVKDGNNNTVVESSTSGESGTGMLLADSINF
jgi:hypothetical protein